jgi:hypothetical protein
MRVHLLVLCGLLISCGAAEKDGGTPNVQAPKQGPATPDPSAAAPAGSTSLYVADAGSLPTCDSTREGFLAYVAAEKKMEACISGAWTPIELPKGDKGDKGDAGEKGAAAEADAVAEQYHCGQSDDLDADSMVEVKGMSAAITKFSSGVVQIDCLDRKSDSNFTYSDSTSVSRIFSASSVGVTQNHVSCVAFYVTGTFDATSKSLTWQVNGGGPSGIVSCETL